MRNFTPEDLIAFHYNESSLIDTPAIAEALDNSWPLQEKYRVIQDAARSLDRAKMAPRRQSVESILAYGMAALDTANIE
jgi:hypothetical protein